MPRELGLSTKIQTGARRAKEFAFDLEIVSSWATELSAWRARRTAGEPPGRGNYASGVEWM